MKGSESGDSHEAGGVNIAIIGMSCRFPRRAQHREFLG